MSRIGKTPVLIPDKVSVDFDGLTVTVKGPKGELKRQMPEGVSFDKKDNTVVVSPTSGTYDNSIILFIKTNSLWHLTF